MQVILKCAKCGSSEFKKPRPDYIFKHGDKVECLSCGYDNDYTQIERVAIETALAEYTRANAEAIKAKTTKVKDVVKINQYNNMMKDIRK